VVNFKLNKLKTHLDFLLECNKDPDYGYIIWNKWRKENKINKPNLENANLNKTELLKYNFNNANFKGVQLKEAKLFDCEFMNANLENANLENANCSFSNFTKAILNNANFTSASLVNTTMIDCCSINAKFVNASIVQNSAGGSDFSSSDFTGAKIIISNLIDCNLQKAKFVDCYLNGSNLSRSNLDYSIIQNSTIYGIATWDISTKESTQENLTITNHYNDSVLTIDDLEIANFIYLISNNNKVANAIDNISTKVVLILGRFTPERLEILIYIKSLLKSKNYVPILFDFEKPDRRDLTETIGLIGRMSKFIVADLTDAKSIPQELSELIPNNPSLTIYPIVSKEHREYSMFEHWERYPWVKAIFKYENKSDLDVHFE